MVADLVDIARGPRPPTFAVPAAALRPAASAPMARHRGAYYIRLMVVDRPGVIADVAAALARPAGVDGVRCSSARRSPGEAVPVVLTTHETEEAAHAPGAGLGSPRLDSVAEPPRMIRIEAL